MGGPEVKSDQVTWNGSVLRRPAALRTASAPVPFWSPTFSVTEDRLTELDGDALADRVLVLGAGRIAYSTIVDVPRPRDRNHSTLIELRLRLLRELGVSVGDTGELI